jgi:hypothetical protein
MRTLFYVLVLPLLAAAIVSPSRSWAPPAYPCQSFSDVWPEFRRSTNIEDWRALVPAVVKRKRYHKR